MSANRAIGAQALVDRLVPLLLIEATGEHIPSFEQVVGTLIQLVPVR
jgi:hypothetical protein